MRRSFIAIIRRFVTVTVTLPTMSCSFDIRDMQELIDAAKAAHDKAVRYVKNKYSDDKFKPEVMEKILKGERDATAISTLEKLMKNRSIDALNNAERDFERAVYRLNAQTSKLCFACGCPSGGTQSEMCWLATQTRVHGCPCHGNADDIFYLLEKLTDRWGYNTACNYIIFDDRELGECINKLEADYKTLTGRDYDDDAALKRRLEEGTSCPDSAE